MSLHTKHKIKAIPAIVLSLVGLTIISGFLLSKPRSSSSANAVTSTATASVTVPDTCYMSSTSYNHNGTVNGGSYTENFGGESTVTVTCNDRNGYSVYAVGCSGTNTDCLDTNHTSLIGTSTGLVIPTGTSTSTNVSNWAMKLTPGTGTFAPTILSDTNGSFANYHVVPATATKVATLTSDINVSNSSQFKTSYAVSVAPTQAADAYIGKVKYTVVHPNYANSDGTIPTYTITLGFNNADSIIIDGTSYSSSTSSVTLSHGTHTISGTFPTDYEISYWDSTSNIVVADTSSDSTTINVAGTGTLTLNGLLNYCTRNNIADSNCMQKMTFTQCQQNVSNNIGDNITVYDARDGNSYTVRYINGGCWMTKDLRITGTIASKYSNFSGDNFNTCKGDLTSGDVVNEARCHNPSSSTTGTWYNYCAASAGTRCSNTSTNITSDICPSGWHLPTGPNSNTNTDFYNLVGNTYTADRQLTTGLSAFSQTGGGIYRENALKDTGAGYRWFATSCGADYAYFVNYWSSNHKSVASCSPLGFGQFIRCVKSE